MNRLRIAGRFISKRNLSWRRNVSETQKNKKQRIDEPLSIPPNLSEFVFEGRRVVELDLLGEGLWCKGCELTLSIKNTVKEVVRGLASILTVKCEKCGVLQEVPTSKSSHSSDNNRVFDVNCKMALGVLDGGMGMTHCNALLSALNIPTVAFNLFKRHERIMGPAVEKVANESCVESIRVEKALTMSKNQPNWAVATTISNGNVDTNDSEVATISSEENLQQITDSGIDSICLSSSYASFATADISEDINDEMHGKGAGNDMGSGRHQLSTDSISSNFNTETPIFRNVATSTPTECKSSFDAGWQKKGAGRRYDSLTAHSSLIGHESGLVLGYATRVKRCARCKAGQSKESHDCRFNFSGSAKAMEADMAVQLVAKNPDLERENVLISTLIGDDDSSTIASVRRECAHPVTKWSDVNHASKTLGNDMHKVRPKISQAVIDYFSYNFGIALKTNKGNAAAVEASLRAMVPHSFNDHSLCGSWCGFNSDPAKYKHQYLPNNEGLTGDRLRDQLNEIMKFIANAEKLAPCGSSQANESFNRTVLSKAPKTIHYGNSESIDYRVALSDCQKNIGTRGVVEVFKAKSLSPGSLTKRYRQRLDEKRARESRRSRTVFFKRNRLTGKKLRAQRRALLESEEGVSYQSRMGYEISEDIDDPVPLPAVPNTKVVVFDLETTGLGNTAEVVQIAAKYDDAVFNQYILPSKGFSQEATDVTGLSLIGGELTLHGDILTTISSRQSYTNFVQFLENISPQVVLVAHNGFTFDARMLTRDLITLNIRPIFKAVVTGFADTLPLFKKKASRESKK